MLMSYYVNFSSYDAHAVHTVGTLARHCATPLIAAALMRPRR